MDEEDLEWLKHQAESGIYEYNAGDHASEMANRLYSLMDEIREECGLKK